MKSKFTEIFRGLAIITIVAVLGFSMAACGEDEPEPAPVTQPGTVSYDIEADLLAKWLGCDYDYKGFDFDKYSEKEDSYNVGKQVPDPEKDDTPLTIQFSKDSVDGTSDIVLTINVMLNEMKKEGDAKFVAKGGVMRFEGKFGGSELTSAHTWWTYELYESKSGLKIRDVPISNKESNAYNGGNKILLFDGAKDD